MQFANIKTQLKGEVIEHIVKTSKNCIRNILIKFPGTGIDAGLELDVEIFHNQLNNNHNIKKYEFPQFDLTEWKKDNISSIIKQKGIDVPNNIIKKIEIISKIVNNKNRFMPYLETDLKIYENEDNKFALKFNNMNDISYDFLEYLYSKAKSISFIFISKGLTKQIFKVIIHNKEDDNNNKFFPMREEYNLHRNSSKRKSDDSEYKSNKIKYE